MPRRLWDGALGHLLLGQGVQEPLEEDLISDSQSINHASALALYGYVCQAVQALEKA
jgi:hypothetical protein